MSKPISDKSIAEWMSLPDSADGIQGRDLKRFLRELIRIREAIRAHKTLCNVPEAYQGGIHKSLYRATLPEGDK